MFLAMASGWLMSKWCVLPVSQSASSAVIFETRGLISAQLVELTR